MHPEFRSIPEPKIVMQYVHTFCNITQGKFTSENTFENIRLGRKAA